MQKKPFTIIVLAIVGLVNVVLASRDGERSAIRAGAIWFLVSTAAVLLGILVRKFYSAPQRTEEAACTTERDGVTGFRIGVTLLAVGALLASYVVGLLEGIFATIAAVIAVLWLYRTSGHRTPPI
jgi:hypothetical protein